MSIELRWLKGNWEFGKYKLQYRKYHPSNITFTVPDDKLFTPWIDVPINENKSEYQWKHKQYGLCKTHKTVHTIEEGCEIGFFSANKPQDKTLEEKFKDYWIGMNPDNSLQADNFYDFERFAQIAKEHYKK